jgi:hypothetical protein
MAQTRFTCTLARVDEPPCPSYAWVTIVDSEGDSARSCPRHGVAALDGIASAHVDWADSKALNEWERKALELAKNEAGSRFVGDEHQGAAVPKAAASHNRPSAHQAVQWCCGYL